MVTSMQTFNLEEVKEEYRRKDAIGIPMSVRERYERTIAEIRAQIRRARQGKSDKKLGELLVEQGVLSQRDLHNALVEQARHRKSELLGEILISLGLTDKETLLSVLRLQTTEN